MAEVASTAQLVLKELGYHCYVLGSTVGTIAVAGAECLAMAAVTVLAASELGTKAGIHSARQIGIHRESAALSMSSHIAECQWVAVARAERTAGSDQDTAVATAVR